MKTINNIITAFIFDMDGVITDTINSHYLSWKRLAAEEGIPFSREINDRLRGLSRRDSLITILGGHVLPEAKMADLLARKNQYFLEIIADYTEDALLPGVKPLLFNLKQLGLRTALASSSRNVKVLVEKLQVAEFFDFIADGASVVNAKPAPDLFLFAAAGIQVNPENCIVVEDAAAGVAAAHAAGMKAVGIGPQELVGEADFTFNTLAELDLTKILK